MDILWFRIPCKPGDPQEAFGRFGKKLILAIFRRDDYWQIGYVIPKGSYQQIHAEGIEHLRQSVAAIAPEFNDRVGELQEWKQVAVLSVESNRLSRWYRPGLLLIGDAAHVMSPVGGVGINYAIQDAVVTANVLGNKLKTGEVSVSDLAAVQRQRELPTRIIQSFQTFIQKNVLATALGADRPFTISPLVRWLLSLPLIRNIPTRLVGFGLFPAHVKE